MSLDSLQFALEQELRRLIALVGADVSPLISEVGRTALPGKSLSYASFLRAPNEETIDLTVTLRVASDGVWISADLVQGGTGHVFAEEDERLLQEPIPADLGLGGFLNKSREVLFQELTR